MSEPTADFSFDLYPGLDRELQEIYDRNVASGIISAEATATSGLKVAINATITTTPESSDLDPATQEWFNEQMEYVESAWGEFGPLIFTSRPRAGDIIEELRTNQGEKIQRLFEARHDLEMYGGETPEGENIGRTMEVVLLPWRIMYDNLADLKGWVRQLRNVQDIAKEDFINENILTAIRDETPFYRAPQNPELLLTARQYLEQKMQEDGDFGLMLAQTSENAGLKRWVGQSPDQLTQNGKSRLTVTGNDYEVDNIGVFEWLAMTFQYDPKNLSPKDVSWLLANRLDVGGDPCVPYGYWHGGRVGSSLGGADFQDDDIRPRLAVM